MPVAEATTCSASESRRTLGLFARRLTSSNESGDRVGTKIPSLPQRNDVNYIPTAESARPVSRQTAKSSELANY
ncbi:hypothetical protein Taro_046565 [Colocasia esculenta]|uniref:Uncharacterized protein n=1 Tax=Colocasia esculenta TaxID=4460 RepID=A0A843X2J1_COLES|nr:hypothetical protein [Colocasia esculenta]